MPGCGQEPFANQGNLDQVCLDMCSQNAWPNSHPITAVGDLSGFIPRESDLVFAAALFRAFWPWHLLGSFPHGQDPLRLRGVMPTRPQPMQQVLWQGWHGGKRRHMRWGEGGGGQGKTREVMNG